MKHIPVSVEMKYSSLRYKPAIAILKYYNGKKISVYALGKCHPRKSHIPWTGRII